MCGQVEPKVETEGHSGLWLKCGKVPEARGFVAKNWEKIEIYSFAAKFAAKFIANLAMFLSHAAKFNAKKLHADARFLLVGY